MSRKNAFIADQKIFISRKLYALLSKASRFSNQNIVCSNNFLLSSKAVFFTYKKPFFCTNLSLFPPKAILFHPPLPIPTILNLLSTKNTAVLLQSALILCCKAGASHRFKSLPAIPGEVAAFRKTGYLMIAGHFRKNIVSTGDLNRGSQGFAPRAFWLLFARRKK